MSTTAESATCATTLTVSDVVVRAVMVPFKRPVATKVGHFAEWPLLLIDVRSEQGPIGHSYLSPYQPRAARSLVSLVRDLAAELHDRPASPAWFARHATALFGVAGYQGLALCAVAGLDIALWDLLAKEAGQPLARLLGGALAPVAAYNSSGLGLGPPDRLGDEARALLGEGGFAGLKIRVGRDSPAADIDAVRRVREAVGDDIALYADFNQGLTMAEAIPRCRALDDEGVAWIEEPLRYDDVRGHAQLARDTKTPIILGENFYGPGAMLDAITARACDLVMPDLMRIGGVTGWLHAAAIAHTTGTPMSSHLYPEVTSHLMGVTPTGQWLEWQDWAQPILAEPFPVRDGHVQIPDVPGNGLEWDGRAVERYQLGL